MSRRIIALILVIALSAAILPGSAEDAEKTEVLIASRWIGDSGDMLFFNAVGSGVLHMGMEVPGTWSMNEGMLTIRYEL